MKVLCLQTCLFMIGGHKVRARDRTPLQHIHSLEQTLGQTLFGLCPLLRCGQTYLNRIKRMGSKTFGNHCHMGWFVVLLKNVNYMRPFPASEFCLLIDSIPQDYDSGWLLFQHYTYYKWPIYKHAVLQLKILNLLPLSQLQRTACGRISIILESCRFFQEKRLKLNDVFFRIFYFV